MEAILGATMRDAIAREELMAVMEDGRLEKVDDGKRLDRDSLVWVLVVLSSEVDRKGKETRGKAQKFSLESRELDQTRLPVAVGLWELRLLSAVWWR